MWWGDVEEKILYAWVGIALYAVLTLYVGYKYYARIKTISDFIVAGRTLGFWVTFGTILATWFCSGTSLGGAQMSYLYGLKGVIMDPIASALAVVLFGLFFAAKLRKLKYITVSDFFKYRYGPEMEILSALVQTLGYIGWLGGLLLAYSVVFQLLGISADVGIYLATIITIIYTVLGGMFAVALLDFLRVFIFWVAMWVGLFYAFSYIGGPQALARSLPSDAFSILPGSNYEYLGYVGMFGLLYYIASWINQPLGSIACQDLVQRSLSARNERIAARAAIAAGISYWIIGLTGGALYGLIAKVLNPELSDPAMAMPYVVLQTAPTWAFALFVVGLLATIMSSADSAALIPPSMILRNIVPYLRINLDERKLVLMIRILVVLSTLGALWIALYLPHIYFLTQMAWYMMLFVQTIPFIFGLYWRKANRIGAIAQAAFNIAAWIALGIHFYNETGDVWAAFYMPGPLILPAGIAIFVATSILTQRISPPRELKELAT
ncbi:MAG: hypothetical protein ABWK00_07095 [Desulfurococcaceae archaeon]